MQRAVNNRKKQSSKIHDNMKEYFKGRTLVIGTSHGKEAVLKPLLEQSLGVRVVVPKSFPSDDFGTFSGEVERTGTPLETARKKCEAAYELTGETLVLASEGSFGAHPTMGFAPANEELLVLRDMEAGWEMKARALSLRTNFAGNEYYDWEDLLFFAATSGFPSHGLIVRSTQNDLTEMHKGIRSWEKLKASFQHFCKKSGKVFVETDMRAHHNPTRMKVIREACEKLIAVVKTTCPVCNGPGFAIKEVIKGLPCSQCDAPTQSAKAYVYLCQHCGHSQTAVAGAEKKKEDPMFCDVCNP